MTDINELLGRLEAAEKELAELRSSMKFRTSLIGRTEAERDDLQAKVEAMGRQELGFRERCAPSSPTGYSNRFPLYALPGAQPAPSIPEVSDYLIEAIESRAEQSYRRHHGGIRGQQVTPADALSWHIIHATRDVLATAPDEAKP